MSAEDPGGALPHAPSDLPAPFDALPLAWRLRLRAGRLYALRDAEVPIPGIARPYVIALPRDADAPLNKLANVPPSTGANGLPEMPASAPDEASLDAAADAARASVASGAHLPYWALLWPSGMALAAEIARAPELLAGRRALELGAGLGVTASAAMAAGADLRAADVFAESLLFCRYNALRNGGRAPRPLLVNWRGEAGRAACVAAGPFAVVLAADVLYEEPDIAPLLALVPRLLTPGGMFWLAEPGRRVSRLFVERARSLGWRDATATYDQLWPDDKRVRVDVHRFILPHE